MADSINALKGLVSQKRGFARGNVYRVFLPSLPGASSQEVNLLCTGVNIPGRQIMTQEKKIGLINQKIAYDHAYDDVQLSFMLLNDYGIRRYFETWQNLCINQNTLEVGYLRDYAFDVKIQQLTKGFNVPVYSTDIGIPKIPNLIQKFIPRIGPINLAQGTLDLSFVGGNQIIYECTLIDAFPTTMNIIELSNSQEDAILELGVQLSYKNWRSSVQPAKTPASLVASRTLNTLTKISRLF